MHSSNASFAAYLANCQRHTETDSRKLTSRCRPNLRQRWHSSEEPAVSDLVGDPKHAQWEPTMGLMMGLTMNGAPVGGAGLGYWAPWS